MVLAGRHRQKGFTIVEVLVIIVIIGLLAGIAIVGYGPWRQRAAKTEVKSDLTLVSSAMKSARNFKGKYPSSLPADAFTSSQNVTVTYVSGDDNSYCINGVSKADSNVMFYLQANGSAISGPLEGSCYVPPTVSTPAPAPTLTVTGPTNAKSGTQYVNRYVATASGSACALGTLEWKIIQSPSSTPPWSSASWQTGNSLTVDVPTNGRYDPSSIYFFAKPRCVSGDQTAEYSSHAQVYKAGSGTVDI